MVDQPNVFYIFTDMLNVSCWHNLRFTKCVCSSGFVAACQDESFRAAYADGTANYAPFIPNEVDPSGWTVWRLG